MSQLFASGGQSIGVSGSTPDRKPNEKKKKKNWKQCKRPIGLHKPWQYTHNGDPERIRKRKGDWKGFWRNCGWKLAKPKEGNRNLGTGNTEGPIKDRPKQNYTKIPKIAEDKDKERIQREARGKQKKLLTKKHSSVQLSPVTQSCLTLCDPMDCSTPSFLAHHQLPELTQTQVSRVGDAIQPSHPLSFPSPPTFNLSQHQGLY